MATRKCPSYAGALGGLGSGVLDVLLLVAVDVKLMALLRHKIACRNALGGRTTISQGVFGLMDSCKVDVELWSVNLSRCFAAR